MRESRKLSFFGGEASGVYEVKDAAAVRGGKFAIGREEVKRIGKAARANAKITDGNGASEASGVYALKMRRHEAAKPQTIAYDENFRPQRRTHGTGRATKVWESKVVAAEGQG